jgi:hypothetical protein
MSSAPRALEVLRSIDAAQLQREKNDQLRNECLDREEKLQHAHQQRFAAKIHRSLTQALAEANQCLKSFEDGLSFSENRRPTLQRFLSDCGLLVPTSELSALTKGSQRGVEHLRESIQNIEHCLNKELADRMKLLIDRCEKVVDVANVDSLPWRGVMEPVTQVLTEVSTFRPVEQQLEALVSELLRLNVLDTEQQALQLQSVEDGNIAVNEDIMLQRVMVLEAMSDLITQKFHIFDAEEESVLSSLRTRIAESVSLALQRSAMLQEAVGKRRTALEDDIQRLGENLQRAQSDENIARQGFLSERAASDHALQQNLQKEEVVWKQIQELEDQLVQLAAERREQVDKRVKLTEREERRRVSMIHFLEFATTHGKLLETASRSAEAEELLCEMFSEILQGCATAANQVVQRCENKTSQLRLATLIEHKEHFRKQYLLLGELMFKKDRAIEELEQRSVFAQTQQELAMDSFNPRAKEFALLSREIEEAKRAAKKEIDDLRAKASLYVEAFKPTEKALAIEGITFEHPLHELMRVNKERSRKFTAFHIDQVARSMLPSQHAMSPTELAQTEQMIQAEKVAIARHRQPSSGID